MAFTEVEPAIALWVAPELVAAVTALHNLALEALAEVASACAVRNTPLVRESATRLLEETLRKWLDARPELGLWLDWGSPESGGLRLRAKPAALAGAIPDRAVVTLRLTLGDRREKRVVPIASVPRLALVMDWLRGDRPEGLEDALGDPAVIAVLHALEQLRALGSAPLDAPADRSINPAALTLTHMAHAFVIADYGGHRVLIDPVLHASHSAQEVAPITARELRRVDAIFFTHHHLDHMLPATLLQLPHDTPVFVPAASGRPLTPRSAAFLALMGFRDVREIRAGEMHEVGGGLVVHAVPFTGEGSGVLGFDACAYVVSTPAGQALFHADASPGNEGESVLTSGALNSFVERHGPIDAVFGTWWQERRFLIGLAPMVLLMDNVVPSDWLRDVEFCDCPPEFLEALVQTARARLFVTYAEGNEEGFLPTHLVSSATPVTSFLWHSRADVCSAIEARTGAVTIAAQAFMRMVLGSGSPPIVDETDVGPSRQRRVNSPR